MQIQITVPTKEDAARLAFIQKETWLATYPSSEWRITREDIAALDLGNATSFARWEAAVAKIGADRTMFAARIDNMIVGYCLVKKLEPANQLSAIYVLPEYQGKGIGKALMMAGLEWLGREKDIVLDVATYNTSTIQFYESLGFAKTGTEKKFGENWFADKTKFIPVLEMKLAAGS